MRRILIAQTLYAAGAALCFLNTYYSIAAIVHIPRAFAASPSVALTAWAATIASITSFRRCKARSGCSPDDQDYEAKQDGENF